MPEHISELYLLTVLGMTINKQPLNFSMHIFTVPNTRDVKNRAMDSLLEVILY